VSPDKLRRIAANTEHRKSGSVIRSSLDRQDVQAAKLPASVPIPVEVRYFSAVQSHSVLSREIAVETAVNVFFGPTPFAVMMSTPQDLHDFAYGFCLTEGLIKRAADIQSVELHVQAAGIELRVTPAPDVCPRAASRERNTAGRTGCGLCGITQLDALPLAAVRAHTRPTVALAAIRRALDALEQSQSINQRTHAVHAAAWCSADGEILALREDVGRHNALDKLIGALLRAGHQPGDGFLLITSRCSFEMVEKAAVFGAATLVAISAPTSLAIDRAVLHGMTLLAVARRDSALVFNGAQFVVESVLPYGSSHQESP